MWPKSSNTKMEYLQMLVHIMIWTSVYFGQSEGDAQAKERYSMILNSDCVSAGRLEVPRDKTTFLNGNANSGQMGGQALSCRLMFGPQTAGDMLEVKVLPGFYIEDCRSYLSISMTGQRTAKLGCQSTASDLPTFQVQDGVTTVVFVRSTISTSNYYFQVSIRAYRKEDDGGLGGEGSGTNVGLIVGIIAAVLLIIIIAAVIYICCRRRRKESKAEQNQFVNSLDAGPKHAPVAGTENGTFRGGVQTGSPGSNRRLLGRNGSSEDGTDSRSGDKSRSALDRFGPAPSQRRRQQQVNPYDREGERIREAYTMESEIDPPRPQPHPRGGTALRRGGADQNYEDVSTSNSIVQQANRSPPASPLLSALRSNPKFRRSFHENEADADERARRVSDHTASSSGDSHEDERPKRPQLPPVPRSPSRSPSPQRRGEKIAAIYRARPSSSHDAARLDSDNSNDTPPPAEPTAARDTRHTLRPNRKGRSPERAPHDNRQRGRRRGDEDYDDPEVEEERRQQQRRRDREDEEQRRRKRQQEEEEEREEERRRRRRQKEEEEREEEERRRRRRQEEEEEEEREEERRRKQEKKKKEEERRRREEEEEEESRRRRAAKESDGSEYGGRFKKSASGRRSKGKGPRMGRSRSTGNALEEMDERYQRSRSKSPGSAHSLNFVEGEEDETDLDSNYLPFRRAGSKTSLYASRSSLYGRRRKNSMGETVSVSSRTALDDTDSRMGDFDRAHMSQAELHRLFKSTGELEMRPESAHVVREVGTSTTRGGSAEVYGRKTVAKSRHGKRYSRGTQTPQSSKGGRDRRDSVGSAKSGRSTSSRNRLKSSRSRESLGGRRSRSRDLSDEEESDSDDHRRRRRTSRSRSRDKLDAATDDSGDDRSKRSGHSSHKPSSSKHRSRPRKSTRSADGLTDSDEDHIADDQSVAPSSVAPSSIYGGVAQFQPGQPYMAPQVMAAPGYPPQLVYQPIVAPGGPPAPPPVPQPMPAYQGQMPVKPPIAPKPKPAAKPTGSRWDELVNLTDGMKKRRRQMGESITEDGTESVLRSMWSQPTYTRKAPHAPPSYNTAQHLAGPDHSYSSNYADSSGMGITPPRDGRNLRMASYSPSESNI